MKIEFKKGKWENHLTYAYTARYEEKPLFVQAEDCVLNRKNEDRQYGYDNVTVVTNKKYGAHTLISVECSFEEEGAPLILLTNGLYKDKNGDLRFGDYYEIVLWKNGINVWQMYMEESAVKWKKLMGVSFNVAECEKHTFNVELDEKKVRITTGNQDIFLHIADLPKEVNVGITACEGINRFYSLDVEKIK